MSIKCKGLSCSVCEVDGSIYTPGANFADVNKLSISFVPLGRCENYDAYDQLPSAGS